MKSRVLLICHDVVGAAMAGPGIRYTQLAHALALRHRVTLALPAGSTFSDAALTTVSYARGNWASLAAAAHACDVVIATSDTAHEFPELATLSCPIVIDGYDPLLAEWLSLMQAHPLETQQPAWEQRLEQLQPQLWLGDFFICASERQRDWWLGKLEVAGRIGPASIARDAALRSLIDVVPYGLPAEPPIHRKTMLKGVWPGIAHDDIVVLWGGGLWAWLDPLTAIRAIDRARGSLPTLRLVFPGTRHPNPQLDAMPTQVAAAKALATERGLIDTHVFFGDWVAHADWPNVLLESDIALSLHFDTLETRLAFRSRIFDYLWAGLPVLCSAGDATSDIVRAHALGSVIDVGDDVALAQALLQWAGARGDAAFRARSAAAAEAHTWTRAAAVLDAFCADPKPAADRAYARARLAAFEPGQRAQLRAERDHYKTLAEGYARGRLMRLLAWLKGVGRA
jgi:glycosyltransferase involved in cell wall biosynthesis